VVSLNEFDDEAVCTTFDYETLPDYDGAFYPWFGREASEGRRGEGDVERAQREAVARTICAVCPVTAKCLQYGMERESPSLAAGFFGGTGEDERKAMYRRRRKKADA
jgi:Transcription factor WhiB